MQPSTSMDEIKDEPVDTEFDELEPKTEDEVKVEMDVDVTDDAMLDVGEEKKPEDVEQETSELLL